MVSACLATAQLASRQLCLLGADGTVTERRITTTRERLAAVLGQRPPARVLLEASTESEWVAQLLETLGHDVVMADPNYTPMYGERSRRVKTDRRDVAAGDPHDRHARDLAIV